MGHRLGTISLALMLNSRDVGLLFNLVMGIIFTSQAPMDPALGQLLGPKYSLEN